MSSYGLTAENFLRALPEVLRRDEGMAALASAVADALEQDQANIDLVRLYPAIDSMPEALLDILAFDLKVDWYNYTYPLEAKRNMIKSSWYIHKRLGTAGAVKAAVQAVYPSSDVEEWWQSWYQGDPYHFRIVLETSHPIVPVLDVDLLRQIELYKSFRSWLDGIYYRSWVRIVIDLSCGWVIYSSRLCGTWPERARMGDIEGFPLVVETDKGGLVYRNPFTGELVAGTFPERSTQGSIRGTTLNAASDMDVTVYAGRMCGTAPGILH